MPRGCDGALRGQLPVAIVGGGELQLPPLRQPRHRMLCERGDRQAGIRAERARHDRAVEHGERVVDCVAVVGAEHLPQRQRIIQHKRGCPGG